MDNEDMNARLDKIEKKLDKLLNLTTKLGKVLHLIPVTVEEERAFQITQRNNLKIASDVNDQLNAMENKEPEPTELFNITPATSYGDVLGDDFLGGLPNE